MGSEYFVTQKGEQKGPYSLDKILTLVDQGELGLADYIYDEGAGDWKLLMEHQLLKDELSKLKPKAPPVKSSKPQESMSEKSNSETDNDMVAEWYALKGENKFGPFAITDIVKMLQEKVLFEFDFVWHPNMETWHRIAEVDAFKAENIEKLKTTLMPEISDVFFRRRYRRVKYGGTILVHDNFNVWKGRGVEISAGGAGVVMENALLNPGQTLYLHFKPGDGVPPFNAVCEVVSKKFEEGVTERNAPIRYGLKFKNISSNTQKFLQEFSKRGETAA